MMNPLIYKESQDNSNTSPNLRNIASIDGNVLCSENIDLGTKKRFIDAEGRQAWLINFIRMDEESQIISREEYYPYGGKRIDLLAQK